MSKPWEEVLEVDGKGGVWIKGRPAAWRHTMPDGHACTPEEVVEYGRLFAAAPDMARALLFDLGEHGLAADCSYVVTVGGTVTCSSPVCRQKRAALTKAGVPLP